MGQDRTLTDTELLSIFKDKRADLSLLSRDERNRLVTLTATPPAEPSLLDKAAGYLPSADTLTNALPMVGGAVGGLAGSVAGPLGAVGGAALGGAAGKGFKDVANYLRGSADVPHSVGQSVADMTASAGKQGTLQAAGEMVAAPLVAGLQKAGPYLMQSALKPTLATLKQYRTTPDKLVQTLLDEGVNVTPSGLEKLQGLIGETNDAIGSAVASAPAGTTINPLQVASRLSDTARKFGSQVNPQADLEAISNVGENFLAAHGAQDLTPSAAQALKTGTYATLKSKAYGELKGATVEGEKALARGLKDELAAKVPGIGALNARDSELMAAADAVGRRVALSGNRDPIGFAWVTKNPTTFLSALIDRNPAIKSMIARASYNSAGTAGKVAPQLIRAAVAALASGSDGTAAK